MIKELFQDFCTVIKKHGNPSAIFVVILLISVVLAEMISGIGCPIHYITGINCPGCGMSRALFQILRFDIRGAFLYHPLWWMVPVLAVVWFLRESGRISRKIYDQFLWFFCILFLIVYLYRLLDPSNDIVRAVPGDGLIFRLFTSVYRFLQ